MKLLSLITCSNNNLQVTLESFTETSRVQTF